MEYATCSVKRSAHNYYGFYITLQSSITVNVYDGACFLSFLQLVDTVYYKFCTAFKRREVIQANVF